MAASDIAVQYYVVRIVTGLGAAAFLWYVVRPVFRPLYDRIFSKLISRMTPKLNEKLNDKKKELFGSLQDFIEENGRPPKILEIGVGSGANFAYYPDGTKVVAVDPNPHFRNYLEQAVAKAPHVKLEEFIVAKAEDMDSLPESSVDAVVLTLVLCSVENLKLSVANIKHVLKPGGKYYYIEHVREKQNCMRHYLQILVNPMTRALTCEVTRDIGAVIKAAGFSDVKQQEIRPGNLSFFLRNFVLPFIVGVATK